MGSNIFTILISNFPIIARFQASKYHFERLGIRKTFWRGKFLETYISKLNTKALRQEYDYITKRNFLQA